ncbi:MAG: DUF3622 domain-containing protein [Gammaproteobacteria bacterium]|nr:DUF3622 domain-containing protein [Gammaproteobacteria bacterium]
MARFDYRLVEKNNSWTAEITRKMTSKKTFVTKKKDDFITEKDADEWGRKELKRLVSKLNKRNRLLKESKK